MQFYDGAFYYISDIYGKILCIWSPTVKEFILLE